MATPVKPAALTRRTQAERSAATTAALLDSCARLLAADGYAATTTSRVAADAGVSRGALQHAFADRAELLLAVVREGYRQLVDELRRSAPSADSVGERVATIVEAMLRAYGATYALAAYEVVRAERSNPAFIELHAALLAEAEAELDQLWCATFADVAVDTDAVLTARRVARAAVMGLVARSLPLGPDDRTAAAIAPAVAALISASRIT